MSVNRERTDMTIPPNVQPTAAWSEPATRSHSHRQKFNSTRVTKASIRQNSQINSTKANQSTGPGEEMSYKGTWLDKVQTRLKLSQATVDILPSVAVCIYVQAVAAFFYTTSALTFFGAVRNAQDFSDDASHDGNVLYIVFSVFSGVSSALCAPMILNSGYSTLVIGGSVLMMFSTLSSSVVTSAEILVVPFSVFGACAYGLLKTGPEVAMLDFLNDRRALAAGLSYLGVTIGQLVAVMSFSFSNMVDDANYNGSGNARWPNNMRVIEVPVVFALMSATLIRRPSYTIGSWPKLFHFVPFYILCFINFCVSFGFGLLDLVYAELPDERDFETHPSGSHEIFTVSFISQMVEFFAVISILAVQKVLDEDERLNKITLFVSGLAVAVLAFLSYINEPAYHKFGPFAFYGCIAGLVKALVRVCLPIAMITYTGRFNYKIGLPFLGLSGGLGQLVSYIIQEETGMPDDEPLETAWYVAAVLFTLAAPVCLVSHFYYPPSEQEDGTDANEDEDETEEVEAVENADFIPDDPLGDLNDFDMAMP